MILMYRQGLLTSLTIDLSLLIRPWVLGSDMLGPELSGSFVEIQVAFE